MGSKEPVCTRSSAINHLLVGRAVVNGVREGIGVTILGLSGWTLISTQNLLERCREDSLL